MRVKNGLTGLMSTKHLMIYYIILIVNASNIYLRSQRVAWTTELLRQHRQWAHVDINPDTETWGYLRAWNKKI